jgi:hypothetical protein
MGEWNALTPSLSPLFGGEGWVRGVFWEAYVGPKTEDHWRRRSSL